MSPPLRAIIALLGIALAAAPASAQDGTELLDSGAFTVYDHGKPIAHEKFEFVHAGDSLSIAAEHTRQVRGPDGAEKPLVKKFRLTVDAFDFGLRGYVSNLLVDGHTTVRGIIPGDTAMTVYSELDGAGTADRAIQPPGRLFVLDSMMFTLFDVICRNVSRTPIPSRPVQLVTLGQTSSTSEATVTLAGPDTLRWSGRRTPTTRYTLADPTSTFDMWASAEGHMLKLRHEQSGMEVLRDAPPAAPKKKPAK